MSILSTADLSDYANVSGAVSDTVLQLALDAAEVQLKRALGGRPVVEAENTITVDGRGGVVLRLPWGVTDTIGFAIRTRDTPAAAWSTLAATAYELKGKDLDGLDEVLRKDGYSWPHGEQLIEVTLTTGWTALTIQADIKEQLLQAAARILRSRVQLRGRSISDEDRQDVFEFDPGVIAAYKARWFDTVAKAIR